MIFQGKTRSWGYDVNRACGNVPGLVEVTIILDCKYRALIVREQCCAFRSILPNRGSYGRRRDLPSGLGDRPDVRDRLVCVVAQATTPSTKLRHYCS